MLNPDRSAVRAVPSEDDFTMDVEVLEHLPDVDRGEEPICLGAKAGSISVTPIEPIDEIDDFCHDNDL